MLGPTYGGHLEQIAVVPDLKNDVKLLAYASKDRIAGIIRLPLDGNPHRAMGLIAHPGEISNIACTIDGEHMLTAGGPDGTVNLWSINASAIESQIALGGDGLEPFLNLADESGQGAAGPFYREMEDYFYYAQLKTQGENATTMRRINDKVELSQVPFIMQAMGFYPSQHEIDNLINEVKYSQVDKDVGLVDSVTFEELIKRIFILIRQCM